MIPESQVGEQGPRLGQRLAVPAQGVEGAVRDCGDGGPDTSGQILADGLGDHDL